MKNKTILAAAAALLTACTTPTTVIWTEGLPDSDGKAGHTIAICNPPKGSNWTIWGSFYSLKADTPSTGDLELHYFEGCCFFLEPVDVGKDTLVMRYTTSALPRYSYMPEGFVLQRKGHPDAALDIQYRHRHDSGKKNCFSWNRTDLHVTDMIPALKKVSIGEGTTVISGEYEPVYVNSPLKSWYRITLDGEVNVEASDEDGAYYAAMTLDRLMENAGGNELPDMVIEDWPDFDRRLFMLDVARSFYSTDDVKRLIEALSRYRVNCLQLHLTDDEGWRVEIEGLPELTSYGAFHKLPQRQEDGSFLEVEALHPSFDGSFDPNDTESNSQGFYTRGEMIDLIRYAAEHHIRIIPEIDTPGHSYAAIHAMEARYRNTGDSTYRLVEPEDSSEYIAANVHHHNVLNIALPETYAFLEKVIDALASIWDEAGYPLSEIHMGGDEVAAGAWKGSPKCSSLDLEGRFGYKEYFLEKILDILEPRGIRIDGWQELCQNLSPKTVDRLLANAGFLNAWSTVDGLESVPYTLANAGFPVLMSNCDVTYIDLAYNDSMQERGLDWGGYVDEFKAFSLLPYNVYRSTGKDGGVVLEKESSICGAGAFLWGENLRNFDQATYAAFPKALGIFDRAWNSQPAWDVAPHNSAEDLQAAFDTFYTVVTEREMPWYDLKGMNYRHHDK